ncbi:M50 family metallopeptidase [Paenibacillus marinisediminis]
MINWAGTRYSLHPLFVMLLAMSAITGHVLELITLFTIVVIHELGHVAAARWCGWSIEEVKLLPFGGVAETKDGAVSPAWQECLVAIAGPMQNGILIGIAYLCRVTGMWSEGWADYFIEANLLIGGFNLLPILPLDGGRFLQALSSRWMSFHRSLLLGAWMSIAASLALVLYSLVPMLQHQLFNLNVLVLAIFLLWSNWIERRHVPYRFVRFLMNRPQRLRRWEEHGQLGTPIVVQAGKPMTDILKNFRRDCYHLVYVMGQEGQIRRIIPEQQLIDAYFQDSSKWDLPNPKSKPPAISS